MSISISPFLRNVLNADAAGDWRRSPVDDRRRSVHCAAHRSAVGLAGRRRPGSGAIRRLARLSGAQAACVASDDRSISSQSTRSGSPPASVLLLSGYVAPNALGIAFVVAQALAVAVLAELQFVGLRRSAWRRPDLADTKLAEGLLESPRPLVKRLQSSGRQPQLDLQKIPPGKFLVGRISKQIGGVQRRHRRDRRRRDGV